jgi:hypothetical protein
LEARRNCIHISRKLNPEKGDRASDGYALSIAKDS